MDIQKTGLDLLKTSGQFGAGVVGLGGGVFLMNQVPASVPTYVRGVAAILAAYLAANTVGKNNDYIKSGAAGLGAAGMLDLLKQLTANKTGVLATINSKLPNLSGVGGGAVAPTRPYLGAFTEKKLLGDAPRKMLIAA